MATNRWTFEGQSDGVTPTVANSDDFGDPAWQTAAVGAGAPVVRYTTSDPIFGSVALEINANAGESFVLRAPNFTADVASFAFQFGIKVKSYPGANVILVQLRTGASVNQFAIAMDTLGRMYLIDNTGSSPVTLLRTAPIPLNTPYLFDAAGTVGSANNNSSYKHRLKKVSDATVLDEQSSTTLNLNNAGASPALLRTVQLAKPNTSGSLSGLIIDNPTIQDGATDYIAPTSTPLSLTGTMTPTSGVAPLSVTLNITPTGGTGTTITYVVTWGDGTTTTVTGSGTAPVSPITHSYTSPGTYGWSVNATNA